MGVQPCDKWLRATSEAATDWIAVAVRSAGSKNFMVEWITIDDKLVPVGLICCFVVQHVDRWPIFTSSCEASEVGEMKSVHKIKFLLKITVKQ